MKLPKLDNPPAYQGLYVVDFGDHTAVGYTAAEVAMLLESEQYRKIHVLRIVRAYPDGRLELKGVPNQTFQVEDGIFFCSRDLDRARHDFELLRQLAHTATPPCRAKLQLAKLEGAAYPYVVALIFPAEHTDDVSQWLLDHDVQAGQLVEGGPSRVSDYYAGHQQLNAVQIWSQAETAGRTRQQVLAAVGDGVQR